MEQQNTMSIYIHRMYAKISLKKICDTFQSLDLGLVHSVEFHHYVSNHGEELKSAFVYFSEMCNTKQADNFVRKIEEGEQVRIVYNDPKYWLCVKNNNTRPTTAALSCENEMLRLRVNSMEDQMFELNAFLKTIVERRYQLPVFENLKQGNRHFDGQTFADESDDEEFLLS